MQARWWLLPALLSLVVVFAELPVHAQRGGGFGGRGGGDPTEFLRRLDTNGNGRLDPDETQGRGRAMLERIAQQVPQLNLNLNRPIRIDQLARALQQAGQRQTRGNSGRGNESSDGTNLEPLVPGFGLADDLQPPPGFGPEGELFAIKVTDEDREMAEERFRRLDRNGDGFLAGREIRREGANDDPFTYDRNKDGRLDLAEMAVRYAQRRIELEEEEDDEDDGRRGGNRGNRRPDLDEIRAQIANRFRAFREDGGEGGGGRQRGGRGRGGGRSRGGSPWGDFGDGGFSGGDFFGGGRSRGREEDEESEAGGNRRRGRNQRSQDRESFEESAGSEPAAVARTQPNSYRVQPLSERLPAEVPPWFGQLDADKDGQVAMSEYSSAWSNEKITEFRQWDLNQDGLITPQESIAAQQQGAPRASTSPAVAGLNRRGFGPGETTQRRRPAATTATAAPSTGSGMASLYTSYYTDLIKKYDQNGDGELTAQEWKDLSNENPEAADADGNGRVTVEEFVRHRNP